LNSFGASYAKPPSGDPEQVLAYLGRRTHRVAIANSRLIWLSDGNVRFTWKDYRPSANRSSNRIHGDCGVMQLSLV